MSATKDSINNPSKRMCSTKEIADLAIFLTSDKANYINGEIFMKYNCHDKRGDKLKIQ